jgi:hypothetical protein
LLFAIGGNLAAAQLVASETNAMEPLPAALLMLVTVDTALQSAS